MSMMVKWCLTTSAYYNSLETKEPNFLYFLDDTKEIYRGDVEYTSAVNVVDEYPEFAAKGKLYVLSSTLETKTWNGTEWKTVAPGVSTVLTDDDVQNGTVTGEAVKAYVGQKVRDIVSGMATELDTDKVFLASPISVLGQTLGSYKDGDTIEAGTTLTSLLKKQFAKQIPPTYTAPSFSMSPGDQSVESGSLVTPTISGSYNQQDGGAITSYVLTRLYDGSSEEVVNDTTLKTYSQPQIMVKDGASLKYTGVLKYADGPIKNDNLGEPYPDTSIKANQFTRTCTYTGKRKCFYGRDKESAAADTSDAVRALPQNVMAPAAGTKLTISILAGDTRVTFAYPANLRDVNSVVSSALNLNVKDTFTKELVDVEGANGYNVMQYKVYTYIPAIPFASSDTYTVTI